MADYVDALLDDLTPLDVCLQEKPSGSLDVLCNEKVFPILRDFDNKARTCSQDTLRRNGPTMSADELFRDGQAQPAMSSLAP